MENGGGVNGSKIAEELKWDTIVEEGGGEAELMEGGQFRREEDGGSRGK
jgi:hypothetical protein